MTCLSLARVPDAQSLSFYLAHTFCLTRTRIPHRFAHTHTHTHTHTAFLSEVMYKYTHTHTHRIAQRGGDADDGSRRHCSDAAGAPRAARSRGARVARAWRCSSEAARVCRRRVLFSLAALRPKATSEVLSSRRRRRVLLSLAALRPKATSEALSSRLEEARSSISSRTLAYADVC